MSDTATVRGALGAVRWDDGKPAVRFEHDTAGQPDWDARWLELLPQYRAANPRPADGGTS